MDDFTRQSFKDERQRMERSLDDIESGCSIAVIWCDEDVQSVADNYDVALTDAEVQQILLMLKRRHDAEIGINWDVIDYWVTETIRERSEDAV